jgi:hypothetical protein
MVKVYKKWSSVSLYATHAIIHAMAFEKLPDFDSEIIPIPDFDCALFDDGEDLLEQWRGFLASRGFEYASKSLPHIEDER